MPTHQRLLLALLTLTTILAPACKPKEPAMGKYIEVFRYPDRAHLNAELVRYGHARVAPDPAPEYADLLHKLEAQARDAKLGIWK